MRTHTLSSSVLLLTGMIVCIVLLATSLDGVPFGEGHRFGESVPGSGAFALSSQLPQPLRAIDYGFAYGSAALFLAFAGWYFLRRNAGRGLPARRRSRALALLLIVAAVALVFALRQGLRPEAVDAALQGLSGETMRTDGTVADPLVSEPSGDDTLPADARPTAMLFGAFLAALASMLVAGFFLAWRRRRRLLMRPATTPRDEFLVPIQSALEALRRGRDAADAVEHCYRTMLAATARAFRVDPKTLTPREFVSALSAEGFSGDEIRELSQLFEVVHYGHRPSASLVPRAMACLTAVRERIAGMEAET